MLGLARPVVLAIFLATTACSFTRMAANGTVDVLKQAGPSVQEESDSVLAGAAILNNLKMMEGLLRVVPENTDLLRMAAEAFGAYAYGFLTPQLWTLKDPYGEEADGIQARIVDYLNRANTYARKRLKLVEEDLDALIDGDVGKLKAGLAEVDDEEEIDALFWVAHTMGLKLEADPEDLEVVATLPTIRTIMERVREVAPGTDYGQPHLFFAVSDAILGPGLGGDLARSAKSFEEGLAVSNGNYLLGRYLRARYLCVARQDRACFERDLQAVIHADPAALMPKRLTNVLVQGWARHWLARAGDIF